MKPPEGYESLNDVLTAALDRASHGKGKERHGSGKPFLEQPILKIASMTGPGGHAYQIMKKAQEALRMESDAAQRELLDIIVYAAAWWLLLEKDEFRAWEQAASESYFRLEDLPKPTQDQIDYVKEIQEWQEKSRKNFKLKIGEKKKE